MTNSLLQNDWPTQTQDMAAATDIVNRYIELNDGEPLGFIEVVIDRSKQKAIEVRLPEWVEEILTYFREQYGNERGNTIATKVITRFLLKDETIH